MTTKGEVNGNDLPTLNCQVAAAGSSQAKALTVGDVFSIECGAEKIHFNPKHLRAETKAPHQLKILRTETMPDGRWKVEVVSYRVGTYTGEDLVFTDGVNKAHVNGVTFQIRSVIDPQQPPKGPIGSFGGYILWPPLFYVWALLALAGFFVSGSAWRWWSHRKRTKLIEGLKKYDHRMGPQNQLHSRLRSLDRQGLLDKNDYGAYLKEIDDILRLYVIRQFRIPALDWSDRLILKDFQKRYQFLGTELFKELNFLLREIRKLKAIENKNRKDTEQLLRRLKLWADKTDRSLGALKMGVGRRKDVLNDMA